MYTTAKQWDRLARRLWWASKRDLILATLGTILMIVAWVVLADLAYKLSGTF